MNFSKKLKQELLQIKLDPSEVKVLLLAFFDLLTTTNQDTIIFNANNELIHTYIKYLIKKTFSENTTYEELKDNKIAIKNNIVKEILPRDINIQEELINTNELKRIFLRGAFLARGSITDPSTANYHLEIQAKDKDVILYLQRILILFELNAKIAKRRTNYIVYLKEAEKISDFIKLTGATQTLFEFENCRIDRDFHNSLTKLMNCEIHNSTITTKAANKQLDSIEILEKYHSHLIKQHNLEEVIVIRKDNPQASLNELCNIYFEKYNKKISKSSLYRKYQKINTLLDGSDE